MPIPIPVMIMCTTIPYTDDVLLCVMLPQMLHGIFSSSYAHMFYMQLCNRYSKCQVTHVYTTLCACRRLDPNPFLLLGHFFAVAFYAMYSVFKMESPWLVHKSAYRSTCVFLSACNIIFPLIWSELKTVVRL